MTTSPVPEVERGRELVTTLGSEPLYGTPAWVAELLDVNLTAVYRLAEIRAAPFCGSVRASRTSAGG